VETCRARRSGAASETLSSFGEAVVAAYEGAGGGGVRREKRLLFQYWEHLSLTAGEEFEDKEKKDYPVADTPQVWG